MTTGTATATPHPIRLLFVIVPRRLPHSIHFKILRFDIRYSAVFTCSHRQSVACVSNTFYAYRVPLLRARGCPQLQSANNHSSHPYPTTPKSTHARIRALFFSPRAKKNPTLPHGRDLWGPSCEVGVLSGVSWSLSEDKHPTCAVFKRPSNHVGQRNNVYSRTRQGHVQLMAGVATLPSHRSTCRAPQRFYPSRISTGSVCFSA